MYVMEKMPSFENKESTEQQLIRLLKERGSEDLVAKSLLDTWTREQERQVEKENNSGGAIELNLRRARLYFEAGYVDEALENFEAARMQARNENKQEVYQAIMAEMDKLESDLEQ